MILQLKILGVPQPKQSVRSYGTPMPNGKVKVRHYQTDKIKSKQRSIALDVKSQLPKGFKPYTGKLAVKRLLYVFPPQKNWPKKKLKQMEEGAVFYREVKPDLTDNLNKLLFDSLEGIIYSDDARIVKMDGLEKIYGFVPRIEIEFEPVYDSFEHAPAPYTFINNRI